MTDIDFDGIRAELICAITALNGAIDALQNDFSNAAIYARVDLGHIVRDLQRAHNLMDKTEEILKGANK